MRLVVQRVCKAECLVDNDMTGSINTGFMVLVGLGNDDDEQIVRKMAEKLSRLRVFNDENGKINLALSDVSGKVLSISQFTLYADASKGNRPSFTDALSGEKAEKLYEYFNECLRQLGIEVETGIFGADMKISLINDGPVTIILDSDELW